MPASSLLVTALAIVGATEAGAQQKAAPAQLTTVTIKVSGMSCSICAATVERTAKRLRGVTAVTASQPKAQAEVTFDAAVTTAEEIAKFIAKSSGFQAEIAKNSAK